MTACHSRDTVAKLAKLHPLCNKISRIEIRISGGKRCQKRLQDVADDVVEIISSRAKNKS
jgi:hypothetical protein